jgi:4-amino-4-deoxy-L-arabinose transferase-like glycosyltransferase
MTKKSLILFGFILLKFLLQYFLIHPEYDLQRDEYLHLDQANHLAWGYLSVPPFTSWVSYLISCLGNSVFWVKFFPALFGVLTIYIVWKAIEELNGNLFALILGATCVTFSALLRINTLYQPNSFDILSWTAFYFVLIKYIHTEKQKWLYVGAIVFAIGFLNKYNIIFLLIGLFPAVLLTEHRKVFIQKNFYLAILLALLLISPNLIWQCSNHFPVVQHMKELAETQLVHVDRMDFLKGQLFFFLGSCVVIISGLYALLVYPAFKKYRLFFWSIIFTLLVFTYFKAKDYYAIGLYPIYISFGCVFLTIVLNDGWKKYLQAIVLAIPVLLFIPMYTIAFPNKTPEDIAQHQERYKALGMLRWEDGEDHALPQDFADMLGWRALAEKMDSIYAQLPNPDQTIIICDNYGQSGAINYYTKNKKMKAVSFNADYINWFHLDKKITDVILVKEPEDKDKSRKKEVPFFDTVYLAGKRVHPFAREQEISIYLLKGAKIDVNKYIETKIKERKNAE